MTKKDEDAALTAIETAHQELREAIENAGDLVDQADKMVKKMKKASAKPATKS